MDTESGHAHFRPGDAESTATIREAYRTFVLKHAPKTDLDLGRVGVGVLLSLTVVGLPFGVIMVARAFRERGQPPVLAREELAFIERAVPVFAVPIMVNSDLLAPGSEDGAPGVFLISFELTDEEVIQPLIEQISRLAELPSQVSSSERRWIEGFTEDTKYQRGRRRRVPRSATDGRVYYAVDLALSPDYLVEGHIHSEMPVVTCLAEPGDAGRIRLLPYWLSIEGVPAPKTLKLGLLVA